MCFAIARPLTWSTAAPASKTWPMSSGINLSTPLVSMPSSTSLPSQKSLCPGEEMPNDASQRTVPSRLVSQPSRGAGVSDADRTHPVAGLRPVYGNRSRLWPHSGATGGRLGLCLIVQTRCRWRPPAPEYGARLPDVSPGHAARDRGSRTPLNRLGPPPQAVSLAYRTASRVDAGSPTGWSPWRSASVYLLHPDWALRQHRLTRWGGTPTHHGGCRARSRTARPPYPGNQVSHIAPSASACLHR